MAKRSNSLERRSGERAKRYTPRAHPEVTAALEAAGLKPEIAEVTMRAENTIALTGDDAARMQKLLDVIEDLDDVQDVFHNAEIGE